MRKNSKLGIGFYFNYAKKSHKKNRFLKNVMIFLSALTIAFSAIAYNFGDEYIKEQENLLNEISNREIFVVNKTTPLSTPYDLDENLSIAPHESESISRISEIDKKYPFFEFRSSGYDIDLDTGIAESKIKIISNKISEEHRFDLNSSNEFDEFVMIPYYPEQKLEKRVEITGNGEMKNGVFISHHFAELLNIHNLESNLSLYFDIYVPVVVYDTIMSVGEENSEYDIDVDISKKVNFNFEVVGVLNSNVRNIYTTSGDNVIYVPYSVMQEKLHENLSVQYHNSVESQNYKEWYPSAYVVFAKSYNDIQPIMTKIRSINPNFQSVSNYQDVDSMNKMIEATRDTARWITVIILTIIFLLMSIIYLNNTMRRRYEISLLKANGMTQLELFKLVMVESIRHVILVTFISSIISFTLVWIINLVFSFNVIKFSISIIIHNILVSMLSILIPTVIAIVAVNRFKPDKIMRN